MFQAKLSIAKVYYKQIAGIFCVASHLVNHRLNLVNAKIMVAI